ncbi:MAG: hypothetical protein LBC94_00480 [Desulfovibrio sp.]|jgi:hypothetical protein|nr:hypothetical protein [Desulfovibrio sp.]
MDICTRFRGGSSDLDSETEQTARATVGRGVIIVRDSSAAVHPKVPASRRGVLLASGGLAGRNPT